MGGTRFLRAGLRQGLAKDLRGRESTHKGVHQHSKYVVTQVQQQGSESPTVTLTWHSCKCKVRKDEDVLLAEFMYLVFTRMPGESYRRRLRSLSLCLCCVFRALINSLAW